MTEELKSQLDYFKDEPKYLRKVIEELEQENKELKEEKLYRGIDRQFIEDANDRLYFEAGKYRKVLEEIREMCNKHLDAKEICYATQVIDKIDEVLNP